MASDVSIANSALIEMGQTTIISLSDTQANETGRVTMANALQGALNLVLRKHPFACTVNRQVLSPDEDTAAGEYAHKFLIPSDYAGLYALTNEDKSEVYLNGWRREAGYILTDYNPLVIYYAKRFNHDDLTSLDDHVADAVSAYLVYKTCLNFGYSKKEQLERYTLFKEVLRDAKGVDQREYPHLVWLTTAWQQLQATGANV